MNFLVVADGDPSKHDRSKELVAFARKFGTAEIVELKEITLRQRSRAAAIVIDIDVTSELSVQLFLQKFPRWTNGNPRLLFIIDRDFRSSAQAFSLGASEVFRIPADEKKLATALFAIAHRDKNIVQENCSRGVAAAHQALKDMFEAAKRDNPVDMKILQSAGKSIDTAISQGGIDRWIDTVRQHHYGTYQHCLLVAGVTVGFGRALGFRRIDRDRIAIAALLHDVGKSKIPTEILDKPGRLSDREMAIVRTHAEEGSIFLLKHHKNEPELIDVARHHHELIDGSGYPDGLTGSEISDPVRLVTVCDIYSALIERRSYKPPFSREKATGILSEMGPAKLDADILAAFVAFVSKKE